MEKVIRFVGGDSITNKLINEFEKRLDGKKLIIDTTHKKRNLPILYKVEDEIVYDIYDYLNYSMDLVKVIVEVNDDVHLIASSYFADKVDFDQSDIDRLLEEADGYDYLLIQSNDIFDLIDFYQVDNIIVGEDDLDGENYFISDQDMDKRIGAKTNIDYARIFDNYINKKKYSKGLANRIKELFTWRA